MSDEATTKLRLRKREKLDQDEATNSFPPEKELRPQPRPAASSSKSIKNDGPIPRLPKEDRNKSKLAQLWLTSRLQTSSTSSTLSPSTAKRLSAIVGPYREKGEDRPLTVANIRLAIVLVSELWRPFLRLFWDDHKLGIAGLFARRVIKGFLPACRAWSQAEMLDIVQRSFQPGTVNNEEIFRTAVLSLLLTASDDIYRYFSGHQDHMIMTHINHTMERSYLSAQLSLSIPSMSSPYVSSILYEAGVFAGFESHSTRSGMRSMTGGPASTLQSLFSLVTITVEVVTQILLLLRTLSSGGEAHLTASNLTLILLSLAPSIFRLVGAWLLRSAHTQPRHFQAAMRRVRLEEQTMKDMGRKGDYKQEVVLFGLRDWIMERWDKVRMEQLREQEESKERRSLVEVGLGVSQHGIQTVFYVLLAMRTLSTSLSLGSIKLYQSIATSLLSSIRTFTSTLESAFQTVFYLAAFIEATSDPDGIELSLRRSRTDHQAPLINYESTRQSGGMSIVARNLGFTYPGSSTPVLSNINLTIRAGETLAIVGFNGGGKTTLVKALMGLYDHTGDLSVNDHPVADYIPQTLHRRTSCLFQDFCRYSLTLRENVGIGNVKQMNDNESIELAIERGGAEKIREKVGLEGKLNRTGVPDASNGEDITIGSNGLDTSVEREIAIGRGEGGMRGRGGGPGGPGGPGRGGRNGGGRGGPPHGFSLPPPPPLNGSPPPGAPLPGLLQLAFGPPHRNWGFPDKENRAALSGGQWQRVALSRAFLRSEEADLVVFDEPSASLDPRAEATLFQRIHALSNQNGRKTTTIYISHRFSTVRKADQIAVVEEGTIAEVGSHAELMALNGRYAELFNLQKEGFE